jgi:hypothetical protein
MDHGGQGAISTPAAGHAPVGTQKKTEAARLLQAFEELWEQARPAFTQERSWARAKAFALNALVCLGRRTVTGMIMSSGRQFEDWSADYRLFSKQRWNRRALFEVLRRRVVEQLPEDEPLVVALDDSLLRKRGTKIPGVAYRRDPLSPPFQVNLVRGQRFVQLSAALPTGPGQLPARMIPIDFCQCPSPRKPSLHAPPQSWQDYERQRRATRLSLQALKRLYPLRHALDQDPGEQKRLLVTLVDGALTNRTILKQLPARTLLIGRIRKDAKLYYLPRLSATRRWGRTPQYGERAPTPEELRKDPRVPYQSVSAWATGKLHRFKLKTIAPLRWRTAGQHHCLRLVVIAPLGYRLTAGSRILYRQPAYLLCTDPQLPLERILQFYLWRWDIEVNFRDEKYLLGVGQAMVRHPRAVEMLPALIIAAYAMLLLAARAVGGTLELMPDALPRPKWRRSQKPTRSSTQQLINHLRAELWGRQLGITHFSDFAIQLRPQTKPEKLYPHLPSAVCYAYS